jgi:hypothetical protein
MNFVEPIRDRKKIAQIKNLLRGERLHGIRKPHYQRITDERSSPVDPALVDHPLVVCHPFPTRGKQGLRLLGLFDW